MRIVLQRVAEASVTVDGETVGAIGPGFLLLVGVAPDDGDAEVKAAVDKIAALRVFSDESGRMNRSLFDVDGAVLVVSQFTLLGDVRKGRRPSFTHAASADAAAPLVESMICQFVSRGIETASGVFGAMMDVSLTNDGPVTLVLEISQGQVR